MCGDNRLHQVLVGGNWPLIVTTNWDSMIEDAWDVACRANVRHGRRFEPHLPVRYRQDVHALFAEMSTYFSKQGRSKQSRSYFACA